MLKITVFVKVLNYIDRNNKKLGSYLCVYVCNFITEKCKFTWPGKFRKYVSAKLCSIYIACSNFQNFTCISCLRDYPDDELRVNSEDMHIYFSG